MSKPVVAAYRLPKKNASWTEYEDYFGWIWRYEDHFGWIWSKDESLSEDDPQYLRVIVADGASESMLAGRWARHLVSFFRCATEDLATEGGFVAAYRRAAAAWPGEVAQYRRERAELNSPVQWFQEPGLAKGAYATLLVAEFWRPAGGEPAQWRAAAVGDSCLFQTRGGELLKSFPFKDSAAFGNQPALLHSNSADPTVLANRLAFADGVLEPGDACYLATDALSAWFLLSDEDGSQRWQALSTFDSSNRDDFQHFVGELRESGDIRNDDTTLVRVNVR
jgi:hypothetical protein